MTETGYRPSELAGLALFARLMAVVTWTEPPYLVTGRRYACLKCGAAAKATGENTWPHPPNACELYAPRSSLGRGYVHRPDMGRLNGLDLWDLICTLEGVHGGTDRGELQALLCEAWGPSPAVDRFADVRRSEEIKSDLRGLAARESAAPTAGGALPPCGTCGGSGALPGGVPCPGCEGTGSPAWLKQESAAEYEYVEGPRYPGQTEPPDLRFVARKERS